MVIATNHEQIGVFRSVHQVGSRIAMPHIDANRNAGFLICPPMSRNSLHDGVDGSNGVDSALIKTAKGVLQSTDRSQIPHQHRQNLIADHRMFHGPFQHSTGMG